MSNVNNLNGIPNFGHGLPEDGVVEAGITDVAQAEVCPIEEAVEPVVEPEEAADDTEEVVVKKGKKK